MAKTRPNKAVYMKASNSAEAAKVLGHTDGGKKFRSRLRAYGVSTAKGGSFDAKAKNAMWALFVEGKQVTKKATKASGGNARQRRTARRKTTKAKATKAEAPAE